MGGRKEMTNVATPPSSAIVNPFGSRSSMPVDTAGVRQAQSRELAEMQTKYLMAQQFPRDVVAAMDRILNAFTRAGLAEKSQYQFARGGTDIVGPSIKSAEAIAQQWDNMEWGFREIARSVGEDGVPFSEVEAFAIDVEHRNRRTLQFIVKHWRDTKGGGYKLKDERDIYELIANQAQRRVRACILAIIPDDVTAAAMQQAEVTLRAKADTSKEAMTRMVDAFEPFGVTKEHIEKRIQRRLDAIQPAQVVMLKRIYASLRDDMSKPEDWFEIQRGADKGASVTLEEVAARRGKAKKPAKSAAPDPAPGGPADASSERPTHSASYAQLADAINQAPDRDAADLVIDRSRHLPPEQRGELDQLLEQRFPPA
jgi:hypothetical protein